MNKGMTRKRVQGLVNFCYILILVLYCIGVLAIRFKPDLLHAAIVMFILFSVPVILVSDRMKGMNDRRHGLMVISFVDIVLLLSVARGDVYYIAIGLLIVSAVTALYEQLFLMKLLMIETLVFYMISGGILAVFALRGSLVITTYLLVGIMVLFVQFILCIIVDHIEKYTRLISDNRRSSEDMLKVVELKRQEAQDAAKAKSMFLSNMSHEIRTPINAMLGMDEIILRESNESNVIEYASKIQSAGNTLLSLVNDILDFSKIESGKMELVEEEYDFEFLIRDIYNLLYLRTEEKGLLLNFDIKEDIPLKLLGDVLRIKQIILNVLTNGVKYTEKGHVTLSIDWRQKYPGFIRLLISVEDTGIGIRKEDQEKLFTAFERVGESRSRYIEGTGLGMSITKSLVELMGGSIQVESEFGKGSIFYIEVNQKVSDYTPIGAINPNPGHSMPMRKYKESFIAPEAKILIVDDNEMNLTVVKGLLKKTRMQIETATNGAQCIEMIRKLKYDIIFMDHMMPEMDGIETYEIMKKMEDNLSKDAYVVALTANAITGAKEYYLGRGFHNYLSKPINSNKMEVMIKNMLPKSLVTLTKVEDGEGQFHAPVGSLINISAGLTFAGNDKEQLEDNIRMFLASSPEKIKQLKCYLELEDWQNYTIEVHALKSNAAYIGAERLAERAFDHEYMGKVFNGKGIRAGFERLIKEWEETLRSIQTMVKTMDTDVNDSAWVSVSEEEYLNTLEKAMEHLNNFESDGAILSLKELLGYNLDESIRQRIKAAYEETDRFNYKKAAQILLGEE